MKTIKQRKELFFKAVPLPSDILYPKPYYFSCINKTFAIYQNNKLMQTIAKSMDLLNIDAIGKGLITTISPSHFGSNVGTR